MKKKTKRKQKSMEQLYGDFLYNQKRLTRYSQDDLISDANQSLRTAYSDMGDALAKTFFLAKNGEASRSEVKKLSSYYEKLFSLINDFKYSFM